MRTGPYRLSRVMAGITQVDMAQALSCSQPTVSRFERGLANLPPAKVERFTAICRARAPIVPRGLARAARAGEGSVNASL